MIVGTAEYHERLAREAREAQAANGGSSTVELDSTLVQQETIQISSSSEEAVNGAVEGDSDKERSNDVVEGESDKECSDDRTDDDEINEDNSVTDSLTGELLDFMFF